MTPQELDLLGKASQIGMKYSVQYADNELDIWTVPVALTPMRLAILMDDYHVKRIRLEIEK